MQDEQEKEDILALLDKLKTSIEHNEKLAPYSIGEAFPRSGWIKASTIRAALVERIAKDGEQPGPHDEKAVRSVLRIDHLAFNGERYSNQCFDVLSEALDVLRDMGWEDA